MKTKREAVTYNADGLFEALIDVINDLRANKIEYGRADRIIKAGMVLVHIQRQDNSRERFIEPRQIVGVN